MLGKANKAFYLSKKENGKANKAFYLSKKKNGVWIVAKKLDPRP